MSRSAARAMCTASPCTAAGRHPKCTRFGTGLPKTTPTPKAYQIEDSDEPVGPKVPVHPVLNTPVSAAPRKRLPVADFHNYLNDHDWIPARLGPVCSRCGKDKEEVKMSRDPEPCVMAKAAAVSMAEPGDEVEMPKSTAFQIED
jgi:hypothetical protein